MSPKSLKWAGTVVRFLVNTEGCGYPPFVNCSLFALKYGHVDKEEITKFNDINQPQTRELYRHGNTTATSYKSAVILEPDLTTMSAQAAEEGAQISALATLMDQQQQEIAEAEATLKVFPCYYSRAYPDRVVADYDWYHTIKTLVAAVVIPWTLFIISCTVLCYWYCPALKREFMIDKRKTAAVKNENPQLVIRYYYMHVQ